METRTKILEIPRLLRETLEKGVREYEALIRRVRWGEGPIYICCCGASMPVGLAGAYLFEWLAGWPVLARPPAVFDAYTLNAVRPQSVLLIISASGEDPKTLEIVREARLRGATVLALTRNAEGPLAKACEGVFLTRDEGANDSAAAAVCQQAALSIVALITARVLKRSTSEFEEVENELKRLPEQMEWSFIQFSDAFRRLARELRTAGRFRFVGGGLYHPVVVHGGHRLSEFEGIHCDGIEVSDFCSDSLLRVRSGDLIMLVSGSRLRTRRLVHEAAAQMKAKGARLISLTDSNDHELAARSELAILMPPLSEVAGATLSLALLELLGAEMERNLKTNRIPLFGAVKPGQTKKT